MIDPLWLRQHRNQLFENISKKPYLRTKKAFLRDVTRDRFRAEQLKSRTLFRHDLNITNVHAQNWFPRFITGSSELCWDLQVHLASCNVSTRSLFILPSVLNVCVCLINKSQFPLTSAINIRNCWIKETKTHKANTIRKVSFLPLLVVTPQTYCLKFRITWVYMICQGKIKHFSLLKDVPFLYVSLTVSLLCPKRATFCIIDRRTEVPCDKGTAKATPFKTLCSWPIGLTGERRFSTLPQQDATSETTTEIRRKNLWGSRALTNFKTLIWKLFL